MDFTDMINTNCPIDIVQKVNDFDLSKFETVNRWSDVAFSDQTPACLSAVVGAVASRVAGTSNPNLISNVLNLGTEVAATNGKAVREELFEMARRIGPDKFYAGPYYEMLWANKLDLTVDIPLVPAGLWDPSAGIETGLAFQQAIYFLRMGVPGAEEHFADGLLAIAPNVNGLQLHIQHMLIDARHPAYQRILEPHLNDTRRPIGVYGRSHAIGDYIRAKLKDPFGLP